MEMKSAEWDAFFSFWYPAITLDQLVPKARVTNLPWATLIVGVHILDKFADFAHEADKISKLHYYNVSFNIFMIKFQIWWYCFAIGGKKFAIQFLPLQPNFLPVQK